MKKRLNYPLIIVLALTIMGGVLQAYIPSRYYVPGLMTYWLKTDTSLSVNVDTASALVREYIIRLADSAAANRSGTTARGEQLIRLAANFSNGANDSINLPINVNGVWQVYQPPYALYLDRYTLMTNEPDGRSASTFRTDLPPVGSDSAFIFRLSRNSSFLSGNRCAITVYKVGNADGLTHGVTDGVFYDMSRFDEAVFPPSGTSIQMLMHLTVKKNR